MVANAYCCESALSLRKDKHPTIQARVNLDRRNPEPGLQHLSCLVSQAAHPRILEVPQANYSVNTAAVTEAKPLRSAFPVLEKCPVEWSTTSGEIGPVADKAPALNEAEHLWCEAPAAIKLLEGRQTLPAYEQYGESLRTVNRTHICVSLKHNPACTMFWSALAKE